MKNLLSIILIATLFVFTSCEKEEFELPIDETQIEAQVEVEEPIEVEIEEPVEVETKTDGFGIEEVEINGEVVFICSMPVMEYYEEPNRDVTSEE